MKKIYYMLIGLLLVQLFVLISMSNCMKPIDRYELKQLGSGWKDKYLLDKKTGRVWIMYRDSDTDEIYFQKIRR